MLIWSATTAKGRLKRKTLNFSLPCNIWGPVIVRNLNLLRHGPRTSGVSWGVQYQDVASRSFESCWMSGWVSVDPRDAHSDLDLGNLKAKWTFFLRSFGSEHFLAVECRYCNGVCLCLHLCFHRWCVSSGIHTNARNQGFPGEHCIVMKWLLLNLLVLLVLWLISADVFVGCQVGAWLLADWCLAIRKTLRTYKVTDLVGREMELVQKVFFCWSCSPVGFNSPWPFTLG